MISGCVRAAFLFTAGSALFPAYGMAQGARYAYQAGDTVRFLEVIEVSGRSTGRGGTQTISLKRDSRIALAFSASDSVRAWYEELAVEAKGPGGSRQADTKGMLRVPFVLRIQGDGSCRTMHTPALPDMVRQLDELYPQFDDFLAMLPASGFVVGATRTDTLTHRKSAQHRRVTIRRIVRSRVERDTIVDGIPAVELSIHTTLRLESTGSAPTGEFTASMVLDGKEEGAAIISKSGTLITRTRSGEARGATTYTGRGAQVNVPQTYRYTSTIRAVGR